MKNLLEAMNNLKEGNRTGKLELSEEDKKSLRDEIFGIVCYWRSEEDGQWSQSDVAEGLRELVNDPMGEDGLMSDDSLYEIFPQLNEENGEAFEAALIREARIIIDDIFGSYGLEAYIEDADKANSKTESLQENYTEKELQPGAKFYGPAGALIQIVEPKEDGLPQYQMTNTNTGKVGNVVTMSSYGQLAQLLSDNHYVKLGKDVTENLQEDMVVLSGEDVSEDFKNYKAFIANFKPVKIMKQNNHFFVYTEDSKDDNDYKYNADSKDNIEGWLYGAVQAANKVIKTK